MRTIPFRDVLWEVARRMGLDPITDLSTEHAMALGLYINSVVRQTWHAADWPEWTYTQARTPDTRHMVNYDEPAPVIPDVDSRMGRVLKVYLNDPDLVQPPLEIAHRLNDVGVHCGFEHGTQVWIKFQPPPPAFTALAWDPSSTYRRGALVYSPLSGECYQSKSNGNQNHNPAGDQGGQPPPLTTALVQEYIPDSPGLPGTDQVTEVHVTLTDSQVEGSISFITVDPVPHDPLTPPIIAQYNAVPGDNVDDVADGLVAALIALLPPGYTVERVTGGEIPTPVGWLRISAPEMFLVMQAYASVPPSGAGIEAIEHPVYFTIVAVQVYSPPIPFVPGQPQITNLKMTNSQALAGATYSLLFHDVNGVPHLLEYVNPERNAAVEVLQGIAFEVLRLAGEEGEDPFWDGIVTLLDAVTLTLQFQIRNVFSLDATYTPAGSPWWLPIHFPLVLADHVIRGAKASAKDEEGQTDKAAADEQMAAAMAAGQVLTLQPPAFNALTDQARPVPRYRMEGPPTGK
jgi:hypothetical protein